MSISVRPSGVFEIQCRDPKGCDEYQVLPDALSAREAFEDAHDLGWGTTDGGSHLCPVHARLAARERRGEEPAPAPRPGPRRWPE